jgi:hypothetical protein
MGLNPQTIPETGFDKISVTLPTFQAIAERPVLIRQFGKLAGSNGQPEVRHERLLTDIELDNRKAACRGRREWVSKSQPPFSEADRQMSGGNGEKSGPAWQRLRS